MVRKQSAEKKEGREAVPNEMAEKRAGEVMKHYEAMEELRKKTDYWYELLLGILKCISLIAVIALVIAMAVSFVLHFSSQANIENISIQ